MPELENGRRLLSATIADYLEEIKLGRKDKTYAAYDLSLRYFSESCSKMYVDEIERKDLLKFALPESECLKWRSSPARGLLLSSHNNVIAVCVELRPQNLYMVLWCAMSS